MSTMDDRSKCQQQMTVLCQQWMTALYVNNGRQYKIATTDDSTICQQRMTVVNVNNG